MVSVQGKTLKIGSVQRRTVLQLFFSHCVILIIFAAFHGWPWAIFVACGLGFLLTLPIPYNLHLLESALDRLARSLPVEPIWSPIRWPLARLFVLVASLSQQTGQQVQMELRNVAYRDQLLQQAGKAAAQEERNRLARDLHDSIKQQIFSIVVSAAAVKARWEHNATSARKIVDDIERTALEAQVEMQALLQQLRPVALENVGLIESLRMQCQALGYRTGAEVIAELHELPPDELLPIGAQEMIFRIVQEGFANIARHARASCVWLSLRRQRDALLVEIGDDGQGFDLAQANEHPSSYGGMGLHNVRERVASLGGFVAIWSLPEKGTTLHLCIPLVKPRPLVEEQERKKQELAKIVRKTRRFLSVGAWTAELAAALMLVYTPISFSIWLVSLCIIISLASLLWAQQYRLQISLDFGRDHAQNQALLGKSFGILAGILLLCMLYSIYFSAFQIMPPGVKFVIIYVGLFLIAIIGTYGCAMLYIDRYYKTLSRDTLRERLRQQIQQVVIDGIAWIVATSLIFLQWTMFHSTIVNQLMPANGQSMSATLLVAWLLVTLLKIVRVSRWYSMLRLSEAWANHREKSL